jgi:hypothetical protein
MRKYDDRVLVAIAGATYAVVIITWFIERM